jgi:hypothetical protein
MNVRPWATTRAPQQSFVDTRSTPATGEETESVSAPTIPLLTLGARSIQPTYDPAFSASTREAESTRWQSLAAPGVQIAAGAKKTSVSLAHVFSRAGASVARSF